MGGSLAVGSSGHFSHGLCARTVGSSAAAKPLKPKGEPWAVMAMAHQLTLPFYDLLQELEWLEGWTPIENTDEGRKAILPGCCFLPAVLWEWAVEDAAACGILGVRPLKFNDIIMLTDFASLEGLREAEKIANTPPAIPYAAPKSDGLRIGMNVRVDEHYWFAETQGIIKRLDAEYAHLDVPGMSSRLTVKRSFLRCI